MSLSSGTCSDVFSGNNRHQLNRNHYDHFIGSNTPLLLRNSLQKSHPSLHSPHVRMTSAALCSAVMASALLPVRLIVAVVAGTASIRVRQVTVLLLFRLFASERSNSPLILETSHPAMFFIGVIPLVGSVCEIRSIIGVYREIYRFLFYDAFLPDTDCLSMPVR